MNGNGVRSGDRTAGRPASSAGFGRLIVGLVLLTLGFLWTLDNFGLLDSSQILRWWPLLLVGLGTWRLVSPGPRNRALSGFFLLAAGSLLALREAHVVHFRFWDLWPVFLMLIGASVVARSLRRHDFAGPDRESAPGSGPTPDYRADYLSLFAFMGGVLRKSTSADFRGGEVTAIMAGAEVDLRGARAASGQAVIDVFTWWGGIDIMVPEDWEVVSEVTPLLGGYEDKRSASGSATTRLIVRGLVVMGGVEVKN